MKCFHEALSCVLRETFVGDAFFGPVGFQRRVSHRCSFGISILKDYWGIGIGSALINESIKHARICGYAQMELGVAAKNLKAQSLYKNGV